MSTSRCLRPRWLRALAAGSTIGLLLGGCARPGHPSAAAAATTVTDAGRRAHHRRSSAPVISGKDIVTLDMLTPERGVGIASVGGPGDELVATRDGGSTWRPTGNLPSAAHPTQTYEVSMAFTSPTTGWVQTTEPDITLFTASAGHSWLRLRTPGTPTSLALESDATAGVGPSDPPVWVTTDLCATPTEPTGLCRTELLAYGPGQTEPGTTYRIPSDPTGRAPRLSEANLLERGSADDGIVEEGSEGSPSRLLATSDAGRSWRTLADPCQGLIPAGLVMGARRSLILYCQLDGGMNQGSVRLYTSTTGGLAWTLTAEGNIEGPRLGNIGDLQASDLTVSGDRRRLWLLGAVVGVKSSADGGLRWNTAAIQTGGYDTRLVTAGADSAWLPLPGIALYRTRTGQSWTDISDTSAVCRPDGRPVRLATRNPADAKQSSDFISVRTTRPSTAT